jgi:hypothetical protein
MAGLCYQLLWLCHVAHLVVGGVRLICLLEVPKDSHSSHVSHWAGYEVSFVALHLTFERARSEAIQVAGVLQVAGVIQAVEVIEVVQ